MKDFILFTLLYVTIMAIATVPVLYDEKDPIWARVATVVLWPLAPFGWFVASCYRDWASERRWKQYQAESNKPKESE